MQKITYFILNPSTNTKEVGHVYQLNPPDKYWEIPNNFQSLTPREFPKIIPDLNQFKLHKSAKVTDVLSTAMLHSNIGLVISAEFKKVLDSSNLLGVQFYDISIKDSANKTITQKYHFLHVINDFYKIINAAKSTFIDILDDDNIVEINESQLSKIAPTIIPKKIVLSEAPDFYRSPYNVHILISQNLKEKIESHEISGVSFEEHKSVEYWVS